MMSIRVCLPREEAGAFSRVKQLSTLRGHHNYQHLLLVDLGACHGLQVVSYGSLQSFSCRPHNELLASSAKGVSLPPYASPRPLRSADTTS